jgi:hypothetical protein
MKQRFYMDQGEPRSPTTQVLLCCSPNLFKKKRKKNYMNGPGGATLPHNPRVAMQRSTAAASRLPLNIYISALKKKKTKKLSGTLFCFFFFVSMP